MAAQGNILILFDLKGHSIVYEIKKPCASRNDCTARLAQLEHEVKVCPLFVAVISGAAAAALAMLARSTASQRQINDVVAVEYRA